jgi:HSP20 family molecular chaperone IbpA
VVEGQNHYELTAELPGFRKDDVTVQVKDGVLELVATPEETPTPNEAAPETRWLLRERRQSSFHRSFKLPRDVDGDAIEAAFRDGLLVLTLPKKEEAKPRVVAIKAA